jgi:hypothetical protein
VFRVEGERRRLNSRRQRNDLPVARFTGAVRQFGQYLRRVATALVVGVDVQSLGFHHVRWQVTERCQRLLGRSECARCDHCAVDRTDEELRALAVEIAPRVGVNRRLAEVRAGVAERRLCQGRDTLAVGGTVGSDGE